VKIKMKKKKTQAQKAMINLGEIRILDWEAQDPLK
jgi:hypothetical protein